MSEGWPIWKTTPPTFHSVGYPVLIGAALMTWLGPVLLGGIVIGIAQAIGASGAGWLGYVFMAAQIALYGGVVTWVFVLVGIPIAHRAFRVGFAGWGVALVIGAILSGIAILIIPTDGLFNRRDLAFFCLSSGIAHGGIFWSLVRWISPTSFEAR